MTAHPSPDNDRHWSLESLDKAYQQGYMAGLTGQPETARPNLAEVPMAAWDAGRDDGNEQFRLQKKLKIA